MTRLKLTLVAAGGAHGVAASGWAEARGLGRHKRLDLDVVNGKGGVLAGGLCGESKGEQGQGLKGAGRRERKASVLLVDALCVSTHVVAADGKVVVALEGAVDGRCPVLANGIAVVCRLDAGMAVAARHVR